MASVTGLTAERIIEIEQSAIVGGQVSPSGQLTLYTRSGAPLDAGNVVGSPGRGISLTTVDYQHSESGTVAPTGEWSENEIQPIPGQFLWTRTKILYTDETYSVSYSIGKIGLKGDEGLPGIPGADGRPSYLHVAYAANSTGTQDFSTTDANGKTFLGTYTDFIQEDSQNPNSYKWVLIKGLDGASGPQGVPGPPGADGTSRYTWIKYADTPTTGMADIPTGKTYLGIAYNKTTSNESAVYSDYQWSLIRGADGIQGPVGPDGTHSYVWVKYATSALGANMSDDPAGKSYIGLSYNKTTPTESTIASDYQWALIKGPDGNGVISSTVTYQVGSSGTVAPTGTWQTTVPLIAAGQFLWTRTIMVFADGATTTAYSIGRHGDNGATGPTGPSGVGVSSMVTWYRAVTAGAAAPAKPTTAVPSGWTSVEPTYVAGTELYTTIQVTYTTNTFTYSNVSKDSSYTAAAEAVELAMNAKTTADGKNKIIKQAATPGSTGLIAGDLWYKTTGTTNNVTSISVWNGTAWAPLQLTADSLIIPGSISDISLADGAVTADKVSADVFVGKVIMGAEIRGTYISGSEYHLTAYSGESSIYYTSFTSLTGWKATNADTVVSLDAAVGHDTSGSLRALAATGKTGVSVEWSVVPEYTEIGTSELSFWVLTPTAARIQAVYADKRVSFWDVPANIWTLCSWNNWVTNYTNKPLRISSSQTNTLRIDEVKLVSRASASREIRLVRQADGTPTFEATAENGAVTGRWSALTNKSGFEVGRQEIDGAFGFISGAPGQSSTAEFHKGGINHKNVFGSSITNFVIANEPSFGMGIFIQDKRTGSTSPDGIKLESAQAPITLKAGTGQPIDYTFGWLDNRTRMSRWGTRAQRLAETSGGGVRDATRWFEADTSLEWEYRAAKWYLVPGQMIDYMVGPTTDVEGIGSIVGDIVTTPNLMGGQKIKIVARFNQYNTVVGVSNIRIAWRNSATPIDSASYSGSWLSKVDSAVSTRVVTGGGSAFRVANVDNTPIQAAIYIAGTNSGVRGVDGVHLWLESA